MSVQDSRQQPLFDVRSFLGEPYEVGSLWWMIEHFSELIIHRQDFPGADPALGGKKPWCPVLKSKLVLIQQMEGWSDRRAVEAVRTDLRVKAAVGLGVEAEPPGQATLSRHRQRMEERGLDETYMERFQQLLELLQLLEPDEGLAVDTVPVAGAGQVRDTYNLLGDGIRKGISALARRCGHGRADVAERLGLAGYLERSPKGLAEIDWSEAEQRQSFLARLLEDARTVREAIEEGWEPGDDEDGSASGAGGASEAAGAQEAEAVSEALAKVIADDIEFDEDGAVEGVKRTNGSGGRLISLTDPQMRHGRKSRRNLIAGFKAHVAATLTAGWIVMVKVIQANRHDGKDLPELIGRAAGRGLWPEVWVGDHAYGILDNHLHVQHLNEDDEHGPVELIARNARPANGGRFTKDEFEIDWAGRTLTCPAGQHTDMRYARRNGELGWEFKFDGDDCSGCPLREQCVSPQAKPTTGRSVFVIESKDRFVRRHLIRRQETDFKEVLAQRWRVEQANAGLAQCGGKKARRFGIEAVEFDTRMSALAYNLRKLGRMVERNDQLRERLEHIVVVGTEDALFILLFLRVPLVWGTGAPTRAVGGVDSAAPRKTRRIVVPWPVD